jgi:UDP-N-acetylenolpyruvoylglucosamine reductase
MKTTFIMNGTTRLVLTPETEAEEVMLKQLTKQENVITNVGEGSHIALTYGGDSIIIMQSTNVTTQAEEV